MTDKWEYGVRRYEREETRSQVISRELLRSFPLLPMVVPYSKFLFIALLFRSNAHYLSFGGDKFVQHQPYIVWCSGLPGLSVSDTSQCLRRMPDICYGPRYGRGGCEDSDSANYSWELTSSYGERWWVCADAVMKKGKNVEV